MRREWRERFPRHRFQRKPIVSDPGMHHGTCVTHVSWCMSGSLTPDGGENVPGIPGACTTHNLAYLARGPWNKLQILARLPDQASVGMMCLGEGLVTISQRPINSNVTCLPPGAPEHGLTLIPAWVSNPTHDKVWDEITYPFQTSTVPLNGILQLTRATSCKIQWGTQYVKIYFNPLTHEILNYPGFAFISIQHVIDVLSCSSGWMWKWAVLLLDTREELEMVLVELCGRQVNSLYQDMTSWIWVNIGSGNGLLPVQFQSITWCWSLGTNINTFINKNIHCSFLK